MRAPRDVDLSVYDSIGPWSETKHEILEKYVAAFARLTQQFRRVYIDGFAGCGTAISRETDAMVPGSPLRALNVTPPFDEFHFVELDPKKADVLRWHVRGRAHATVHDGDCNLVLPELIRREVRWTQYQRAFCLLDPYGLHLDWNVVVTAAATGAIDVLINLPVHDINRNVLRGRGHTPGPAQRARMTAFWGDDSWRESLWRPARQPDLFGEVPTEKASNDDIAEAYCARLREVAGFRYVGEPVAMRNSQNAIVYYLVFASQKAVAVKVMRDVARKSLRER